MQENRLTSSTDKSEVREINLRDYFEVLKKRKTTVYTFLAITVLLTVIITFSTTPLYTASTQILIEENYGVKSIEGTYSYNHFDQAFLDTQFRIIASFNVIKRVVQQLQLDTKYRKYFLKEEKNRFVFLATVKQTIGRLFNAFSSPDSKVLNGEGEDAGLLTIVEPISDIDTIVKIIMDDLKIEHEIGTKIVNISYSHRHPGMAKRIVDSVITAYKEELQEIKHSSSKDTLKWMTEKAEEERKKLEDSELQLQAYMRKNDLVTIENKLAIYPQKLSEFSSQLSIVQAERKKKESIYAQIKEANEQGKDVETIPVFASNSVLQGLRDKIYMAEQNIKQLSKTYGYKNPVMINAKAELNSLKKEKEAEIKRVVEAAKNDYDLAVSQERDVTDLLNTTKNELLNLNEKFVQFSIMKREVNTNSILYDTLTASLKKASVTEQSQSVNVWVIKEASYPRYPSKPKKLINFFLGVVVGLVGGVGLAFFSEYLDNTVQSPKEIEQRFGFTVLGVIEQLKGKDQKIETLVQESPLSPFAESYRLVRSSILFSSVDHPPRKILFTSMAPSEGKTVTTANIARVLSQSSKKVVIVDCDMRKPRQHSFFSMPNSIGLSSYLTGNATENIIHRLPEENLALITAGPNPPNPAELLDSAKMKTLLKGLESSYDFVLLDSPPIQSVTDSLTLSSLADGVVIITRAGGTTYDMIENGLKKLIAVNAHILGFILNGVSNVSGGEHYYHGYYEYYSEDTKKES